MADNNHSTVANNTVWDKLFALTMRFPRTYMLAIVLPFALLGYALLLFFPSMFVISATRLFTLLVGSITSASGFQAGAFAFWLATAIICALTVQQIIRIRFNTPEGITIGESTASKLHALINQIKQETNIPKIDRIIITEQLSLDIAKTPVHPFPIWSINTLVVGLPLMQCLSPEYFECALTRKLIQYSKETHSLPKWLAQLRFIWTQYIKATSPKLSRYNIILFYFFRFYAPIYKFVAIPVANYVELLADQDTLRIVNDEDLLQTIEKVVVSKIYLEKQYWPKINNMMSHNHFHVIEPYSKLEQVLKSGLTPQLSKRWLDTLYCHPTLVSAVPDLRSRMNNIGRSKIRIPEKINETAARYFLDNAYRDIITEINQLWMLRSNAHYDSGKFFNSSVPRQLPFSDPATPSATRMNMKLFN